MATSTLLTVFALVLCFQISYAYPTKVTVRNATLDNQCPKDVEHALAPMPAIFCDVQRYLMCENGLVDTMASCPPLQAYNPNTTWCEPEMNVPLPAGCTAKPKTFPNSCFDEGATKIALAATCYKYLQCLEGGRPVLMNCPKGSYFIAEMIECMPTNEPYVHKIPDEGKKRCDAIHNSTTSPPRLQ